MRRAVVLALCAGLSSKVAAQQIARADAQADLDTLGAVVRKYSAYRLLNRYPFDRHLDSLRARVPDSMPVAEFWRSVQTLIGRLRDSHSIVRVSPAVRAAWLPGQLPFVLTPVDGDAVALAPCSCALFVPGYPRVVTINGIAVDSLMRVAGIRYAGHSPQRFRLGALEALTQIEEVLARAGAAAKGPLAVRLSGSRRDTTVRVAMVPQLRVPPRSRSVAAEIDGPIAILRIPTMFDRTDTVGSLGYLLVRAAMESPAFRASRALIIDVRGNTGGTRDILEYLGPYFIRAPLVYNIAVVRADTNGLGERAILSPDDASQPEAVRDAVRDALRNALAAFTPVWDYTVDDFLPQRFGSVLLPAEASRNMSDRPVVVLMDEGSFSATDVFLGAMSLAPSVTLMGVASGGGSGRSRIFVLPRSHLTMVISTMASFRPDGQLYDGIGVPPDIVAHRTVEGVANGQDTQMAEARRFLLQRLSSNR